jgi:hypothetical protein
MRDKKASLRISGDTPDYPHELPELRRVVTVTDYDFGEVTHVFKCYKTNRVDCYRVVIDNTPWKERIGWSNILSVIRKGFIRVGSPHC